MANRVIAAFKALRATPGAIELIQEMGAGTFATPRSEYVNGAFMQSQSASYAHIYSSQENVRIVVEAIARSAAKRSLKCYERLGDGSKIEDGDHSAAETLRTPNDWQTQRKLLGDLVRDKLIFDDAYLWDMGQTDDSRRFLLRVPPFSMGVSTDNSMKPSGYRVQFQDGSYLPLKVDEVIHWRGYNPAHNRLGVSPLETLRVVLTENAVRKAQTIDHIRGGLIKGGIVTRGMDAPTWSAKARERFQESFASRLRGSTRGEVALLEDGMQFMEAGITPREAEMLASRQFELALTANIYGINPGLFTETGNLAQAREMMEEDVVEPLLADLADVLTSQLIRVTYADDTRFFRFRPPRITDLSRLYEAGAKATGGSVLTPNEFREDYLDKGPIEGHDGLVAHPGSQDGGLPPAPGSDPRGRPPLPAADLGAEATVKHVQAALNKAAENRQLEAENRGKSLELRDRALARRDQYALQHAEIFRGHFVRQLNERTSGRGSAANTERWNRELAADLFALARSTVQEEGLAVSQSWMLETFDWAMLNNYLRRGAELMAANVNNGTEELLAVNFGPPNPGAAGKSRRHLSLVGAA